MNITAIIQARMGSSRLPDKVMMRLGGQTVLSHVIQRTKAIPLINRIVVATTTKEEDIVICQEAEFNQVDFYRGSEQHVLSRYYEAASLAEADIVVRITSDCPLLDPRISERVIRHFIEHQYDYSSSGLSATYPRGLDTEVFSIEALRSAYHEARLDYEIEHVTPYIYKHPEKFNIFSYTNRTDESQYRITLDTEEDWRLISEIYRELYKGELFYWEDILRLLQGRPDLVRINADVRQKKLGE